MNDKVLVTRPSMPPKEEYFELIEKLWSTHWLTNMGEYHNDLERGLKEYLDSDYVSLFCNGHMALELLLQAMDLHGEVITTPFTFASTTHAIVRNGLTPVFCDINPDDYTMDVKKIEGLITDRTTAIVPVHVYGSICNVTEIENIASRHKLKVIYDAAHAFGVKYHGNSVVNYGDGSMLSFHATKVFNTIEGGAVCYRNKEIGDRLYQLKNFGIESAEKVNGVGANAKLNEFQAAMGICNLRHIEEEIGKRKEAFEQYVSGLSGINGIRILPIQEGVEPNYAYFPIVVDEETYGHNRNELFQELERNNMFARKYFYPLTNSYDCYQGVFPVQETPVASYVSARVLTLPMYAGLEKQQVEHICDVIRKFAGDM